MDSQTFVLLSGCLTFGVPLAWAARELAVLRLGGSGPWRDLDGPEPQPQNDPDPVMVRKPLPDCLIPKPLVRQPELVD